MDMSFLECVKIGFGLGLGWSIITSLEMIFWKSRFGKGIINKISSNQSISNKNNKNTIKMGFHID